MVNIKYVGCTRPKLLALAFLKELNTPISLKLRSFLEVGDYDSYFSVEIMPAQYDSPRAYALDALAISLLKKSPNVLSSDIDIRTRELFDKNEVMCNETNNRLLQRSNLSSMNDLFQIFMSKIAGILGPVPDELHFGFGPGVNVGKKGVDTSAYAKFSVYEPTVTLNASSFAKLYIKGTLWGNYLERGENNKVNIKIVNAAEIAFVPKSYKVKRAIAIEPMLNTYFQKGVGSYIRKRLCKFGVDLNQQSFNQNAASNAQQDGLATVDFASASDTIARQVIYDFVPPDWVSVLETFRTPFVKMDDGVKYLSKFSSMGNGYTFELESLLFYAAAYAVVTLGSGKREQIFVYGDDVILPSEDYFAFKEFTQVLGFSINNEKTFASGRFFESCGMDFFDGVNTRPYYLKNDLSSDNDVFECRNSLLLNSERWKYAIPETLNLLQGFVARERRHVVPFPYSGGFWASIGQDHGITDRGWEGSYAKALVFLPAKRENEHFEAALLHSFINPSDGRRSLRGVGKWVVRKLFFPDRKSVV